MKKLILKLSICLSLFTGCAYASNYAELDTADDCNHGLARLTHKQTNSNAIGTDPCIYEIHDVKYENHGQFNALTVETCEVGIEHALLITKFNQHPENKSFTRGCNTFLIAVTSSKDPRKQYTNVYAWVSKLDDDGTTSVPYSFLTEQYGFQEDQTPLKQSVYPNGKITMPSGLIQLKTTMDNLKTKLLVKML